jgi:hypothetical protein
MLAMRSVDLCLGAQRRRESTPAILAALAIAGRVRLSGGGGLRAEAGPLRDEFGADQFQ